jgi:hypothetical protein
MPHRPSVLWILDHDARAPGETLKDYVHRIAYVAVFTHTQAIIMGCSVTAMMLETELKKRLSDFDYSVQIIHDAQVQGGILQQKIGNCARITNQQFAGAQVHVFCDPSDAFEARLQSFYRTRRWPKIHAQAIRFPLPVEPPDDVVYER